MDRRSLGCQRCPLLCLPCLFKRFCRIGLGLSNLIALLRRFCQANIFQRRQGQAIVHKFHLALGLAPVKIFNARLVRAVVGAHQKGRIKLCAQVRVRLLKIVAPRAGGKRQPGNTARNPGR